jgi:ribosomal protein S17E
MKKIRKIELDEEDISKIEAALMQIDEKVQEIVTQDYDENSKLVEKIKAIRRVNNFLKEMFSL